MINLSNKKLFVRNISGLVITNFNFNQFDCVHHVLQPLQLILHRIDLRDFILKKCFRLVSDELLLLLLDKKNYI